MWETSPPLSPLSPPKEEPSAKPAETRVQIRALTLTGCVTFKTVLSSFEPVSSSVEWRQGC